MTFVLTMTAKTVTLNQFIPEGIPMPEHFTVGVLFLAAFNCSV